ncbi:potassium channel family protein [Sphingomonas lutea]|nr:potassium channel family protein [Sphingomonas lutea]
MASAKLRWRLLRDLDEWLAWPAALLSLAWLGIVIWELVSGTSALLETVGTAIWAIFIVEFLVRFALAPEKLPFLRSNWLTLIALVVPALRLFRAAAFLRVARAARGFRLVRIVGTANRSMNALQATLVRRGFAYVLGLTLLVIALGAAGMLSLENSKESTGGFTSYGHALWWTGMLVASLGTDFWPVTSEGRLLAMLLALYGLAVFGYITATFASFFVGRDAERHKRTTHDGDMKALLDEVRALREELRQRA